MKYLNDCPIQPNLPVYLLVVGSMGLVRALNLLWKQFRRRRMRKSEGVEIDQEEETENGSIDLIIDLPRYPPSPSRRIRFHRCSLKSLSLCLVYRRTILDLADLYA